MEQEFKVGDRVVGVGVVDGKDIDWKKGTVKDNSGYRVAVEFDEDINGWGNDYLGLAHGHGWGCPIGSLRRISDDKTSKAPAWSIHITPNGNATHAVFKQGKRVRDRAAAHCNPSDTYDAATGAAWAFLRLPGMADAARRVLAEMDAPTPDEPKRGMTAEECKPGMRVRFIDENMHIKKSGEYPPPGTTGVILKGPDADGEVHIEWRAGSTSADDRWWAMPSMLVPAAADDEPAPVPQPTYKPGDRVRIVEKPAKGTYIPPNGTHMKRWLGKEMTVSKVEDDEIVGIDYHMVEDGGAFIWGPADIAGKVGESRKEK